MSRRFLLLSLLVVVWCLVGCNQIARFNGNRVISNNELEYMVRRPLTNWPQTKRQADLLDAAEAIRNRLDGLGYVWAEVDGMPPTPMSDDKLPIFTIREGPRTRIGTVTFERQKSESKPTDSVLLSFCHFGSWYTTASVKDAPERIVRGLRLLGHLSATVSVAQVTWNDAKDRADIHFHLSSGPLFTVASEQLTLVGDESLRPALTSLLDKPGIICHPRLATETAARLRAYLANRGYLQAQVTAAQKAAQENNNEQASVLLEFTIMTGAQHVVHSVVKSGGSRTSPSFFTSQLRDLVVGEPLSQEKLDQALSSLTLTGLYRQVKAETKSTEINAHSQVESEVVVQLKENPTQHVDFSVGYGSYEQLRGGVEYVDDHLFGRGLRFNTGAKASMKSWETDAGLSDPYLLGPGRRVGIDLLHSERELPSFNREESGATLGVTQRMRPSFDPAAYESRFTYEFKRSEDFRISAPIPGEEEAGQYTTSTVGINVRRDRRAPKVVDPESGTYAQAGINVSAKPLGAEVQFMEVYGSWNANVSPSRWVVASINIAGRTREPIDSESLPIGERLFLGGEDTVRSFTKDDLGPRDINGDPQGGLTSLVTNVELRWRPLNDNPNVEIATFYDIGMVDANPWSISGPPGQAIGGGLRYRTPVGPIRLDGAYNPGDRLGAKHPYAIHLAVGFAF
jgi:outer membrane protein insertion porin family